MISKTRNVSKKKEKMQKQILFLVEKLCVGIDIKHSDKINFSQIILRVSFEMMKYFRHNKQVRLADFGIIIMGSKHSC